MCLVDLAGYVSGVDAVINKHITADNKRLDLAEMRPGRRTWNLDVLITYNLGSCFTTIVQNLVVYTVVDLYYINDGRGGDSQSRQRKPHSKTREPLSAYP